MRANVLLQHQRIGELIVTDGALVEHAHWWLCPMDAHMGLQVALGRKRSSADFAPVIKYH